jgi:hypothetical protein
MIPRKLKARFLKATKDNNVPYNDLIAKWISDFTGECEENQAATSVLALFLATPHKFMWYLQFARLLVC